MQLSSEDVPSLVRELQARVEFDFKRDIQQSTSYFGRENALPWMPEAPRVKNGDDAAAVRQPDGSHWLFAADGMRAEFVKDDPWFAGYSAVMVNISDIAAMGGRPLAIVDVLYLGRENHERLLLGMQAASSAFGVPIVGGHTCRTEGPTLVSCAIIGRAQVLLESDRAEPGDTLLYAVDLRGAFRSPIAFNAATTKKSGELRRQVGLLADLAEAHLVHAAKDVSNAGLVGTVVMMLESSGVGAEIDLERIPAPEHTEPVRWLMAFPSYGFVLATRTENVSAVRRRFETQGIACEEIGTITLEPHLVVRHGTVRQVFCDTRVPLTGWGHGTRALVG